MSERVEVYWNLHKTCYSVRSLGGVRKGLVTCHPYGIELRDVSFAVQPAGRARTLAERRKNVHAFVRGVPTGIWYYEDEDESAYNPPHAGRDWTAVRYNPYTGASFVTLDGSPVTNADVVRCATLVDGKSRLYALNPE